MILATAHIVCKNYNILNIEAAVILHEIEKAQRLVRTDAYQMSVGEITSMYQEKSLVIAPEFQRYFRWTIGQKSKLIESLLLGIPIPSIFVFEREDGTWELVDGLQRVSTILEFMGRLRSEDDELSQPSVLEATKYLPSLSNTVWEISDRAGVSPDDQVPLDKTLQLAIRRARLGVEILKRPSDDQTKYDLFQRLNAGGTQANAQELRNCIMLMINPEFYRSVKIAAEDEKFLEVASVTEEQAEKQRHLELAVRFLVLTHVAYDGKLDVEEFVDESIISLAAKGNGKVAAKLMQQTFGLLHEVAGKNILRRFEKGDYSGRVGLVGLEVIAVGVAKNLKAILALGRDHARDFVNSKSKAVWTQPEAESFSTPGLRGTIRIQRTIPFGNAWFRP